MSRQEQNKLIRAKAALEDCFYNGNLSKHKLTQAEANIAFSLMIMLRTGETVDTIIEGVKNFFERYGFTTKAKGIGWSISLS